MSRPALGGRRFGGVTARGRGTTPAWGPLDAPDLELMLKGTLGVTLVSGKVSAWADQSGNGRDVSQVLAANRPLVVTHRGRDAIKFDGALATLLRSPVLFGTAIVEPFTAYVVAEAGAPGTTPYLIDSVGGAPGIRVNRTAGVYRAVSGTGTVVGGAGPTEAHCVVAGATDAIYGDDYVTPDGAGAVGFGATGLVVGGPRTGSTATYGWFGTISEVLIFGSAHDAAQRAQVGRYLNSEYAGLGIVV